MFTEHNWQKSFSKSSWVIYIQWLLFIKKEKENIYKSTTTSQLLPRPRNIREILSRKSKSNRSEQIIENIQNNKPEVGTPINQSTSSRGSNGT